MRISPDRSAVERVPQRLAGVEPGSRLVEFGAPQARTARSVVPEVALDPGGNTPARGVFLYEIVRHAPPRMEKPTKLPDHRLSEDRLTLREDDVEDIGAEAARREGTPRDVRVQEDPRRARSGSSRMVMLGIVISYIGIPRHPACRW